MWLALLALAPAAPVDPLAGSSLGVLDTGSGATVDTDLLQWIEGGNVRFNGVVEGGVAVFRFDSVRIDENVTVVGSRPVAIVSRADLTLTSTRRIRANGGAPDGFGGGGSGGDYPGQGNGGPGSGAGAGAGDDDGAGGGGFGGAGGDAEGGALGGGTYGDLLSGILAGSGGGQSTYGSNDYSGVGGGGGGGIELGAAGVLTLQGAVEARGGNGPNGDSNDDGGGGGSGGGILLHSGQPGVCTGTLDVRGGTGGTGEQDAGGGGGGRIGLIAVPDCPTMSVSGGTAGNGDDGSPGVVQRLDPDGDGDGSTVLGGDCDDADPGKRPGLAEACDRLDQDCDGTADEGLALADWYLDADGDGAGAGAPAQECGAFGRAPIAGDCDDADPTVSPLAAEACDGLDQDCDGTADDGLTFRNWWLDGDGDGFGAGSPLSSCQATVPGRVRNNTDCDDLLASVSPSGTEVCDGLDQTCDGVADEGLATQDWYADGDGDGFGAGSALATCQANVPGRVTDDTDCDDTSASIAPGAPEACDGLDQSCDGVADEGLPTADWFLDTDGDGFGAGAALASCRASVPGRVRDHTDCDDGAASVSPDGLEVCDGVDQDCDGAEDDGLPTETWWADLDGDGFGEGPGEERCDALAGGVTVGGDCDDGTALRSPGLAESICNTLDDDCDGATPDDADADADGATLCAGDCDDTDDAAFPGQPEEACNGRDDDCDPDTSDTPDDDGDGLGACEGDCHDDEAAIPGPEEEPCNGLDDDCLPGTPDGDDLDGDGFAGCSTDCDDADPDAFPGAPEVPGDGVDQDCDGEDAPLEDTGLPLPTGDTGATAETGLPGDTAGPTGKDDGGLYDLRAVVSDQGCACDAPRPGGVGLLGVLAAVAAARRRR